jgi:putative iron-regulated protein
MNRIQKHQVRVGWAAITACTAWLVGCGGGDGTTTPGLPANTGEAVSAYARIVHASYEDAATKARDLDTAVQALVTTPADATLADARTAWLESREPYLQTEVYRFYDGPIDNPADGPEGFINAWPLDEAYIDYVEGAPNGGIINDPSITIDSMALESLNEQGGEENIATGFHAIEFLLWGQDQSDTGPGDRPYTDYLAGAMGTAQNQDRRGTYLSTVSSMLVGHLDGLVGAWKPDDSSNYRAEMETGDPKESLRRIMTGLIVLSGFETGGERLQTAYDSGEQGDEHSCFSDNTHRDMVQDVQGMLNIWHGSYTRLDGSVVSGIGLREIVRQVDADLSQQLDDRIAESLMLANALVPPFDQEIKLTNVDGRARVQALIASLRDQENLLEDAFRLFGLTIPVP